MCIYVLFSINGFFKIKKRTFAIILCFSLTMSIMGLTNTNLFKFPIYSASNWLYYYPSGFKKLLNWLQDEFEFNKKIELINDFEHNHVIIVNGIFQSCDIRFEEKEKLKIETLKSLNDFDNHSSSQLHHLNKALSLGGFNLEVQKDYKCKKPIVIYNYFYLWRKI